VHRKQKNRLDKLAERIEALAEHDDSVLRRAREISALRAAAAEELHKTFTAFVSRLNKLLTRTQVALDPAEFAASAFEEEGANLFQIHVRGRVLQAEFSSTPEMISTEDFRVPYTLQGSMRCFNQQLLEQELIREHLLFYCLEKSRSFWRYFDERTYHSGPVDEDYLAGLLERLL
jgi:hypothetical protein